MNHRQQFGNMVKSYFERYNLYDQGWEYGYNDNNRILGITDFRKKTIEFSLSFLDINSLDVMEDTIKHEVAHVLAGYEAAHSYKWKNIARQLGALDRACNSDPRIKTPVGPYAFKCGCTIHYFYRSNVLYSRRKCHSCKVSGTVVYTSDIKM